MNHIQYMSRDGWAQLCIVCQWDITAFHKTLGTPILKHPQNTFLVNFSRKNIWFCDISNTSWCINFSNRTFYFELDLGEGRNLQVEGFWRFLSIQPSGWTFLKIYKEDNLWDWRFLKDFHICNLQRQFIPKRYFSKVFRKKVT